MIRAWDFLCDRGHRQERFIDSDCKVVLCTECGAHAVRQLAAPRSKLEGFSGAFPSAADKWERNRESHMRKEKKTTDNHGEDHSWRR